VREKIVHLVEEPGKALDLVHHHPKKERAGGFRRRVNMAGILTGFMPAA
jgi:hypothetical protein